MKNYLVDVWSYVPYKKETQTIEKASSFGTAINRAIKKFRKELGKKKISQIEVNAKKL